MSPLNILVVRDDSTNSLNPTMLNLLIALVVLFAAIALLVGGLLLLRQLRRSKKQEDTLPIYSEKSATSSRSSRLTINTTSYVVHEKQSLMDHSLSPPGSPIPEIRITFPEEIDETGKRKSGRVVVVRVGDHSVGLEPVQDTLPPYQQSESDRFHSLDLDRMGGLKEKESEKRWS